MAAPKKTAPKTPKNTATTFSVELDTPTDPDLIPFRLKNDKTVYHAYRRTKEQLNAKLARHSNDNAEITVGALISSMRWFFVEDTANALLDYVANDALDFDRVAKLMEDLLEAIAENPTK